MRYITKSLEPSWFREWKAGISADWPPSYEALDSAQRRRLVENLLCEQAWTCCYCGMATRTEQEVHIEHFTPRELFPELDIEYVNLHASCMKTTEAGSPLRCGHAKGSRFDDALSISPLAPDCEIRYRYDYDGGALVRERSDSAAAYMLQTLSLNKSFLRNRRRAVLQTVFSDDFMATATGDDFDKLIDDFRRTNDEGYLPDFGHVVVRYAQLNRPSR